MLFTKYMEVVLSNTKLATSAVVDSRVDLPTRVGCPGRCVALFIVSSFVFERACSFAVCVMLPGVEFC